MQYLITFLEGIISFISPCMLPLFPVYVSFFAGDSGDRKKNIWIRSAAFVLGFTLVFCLMGLFAGSVGEILYSHRTVINIVCGIFVIIFGLSYLEIIHLNFFRGISRQVNINGALSAFIFGLIYSVSLTPCIGAFLGSAIMLASTSGSALKGLLLLLIYSLGLGIPFIISAVLIDRLKNFFDSIKKHYGVINKICGIFLIVIGICMMTGILNSFISAV